jgi:predicted amidohydrolase
MKFDFSSFIGSSTSELLDAAESLDGIYMKSLRALAAERSVWLSVGGFPEKAVYDADSCKTGKVYNTHVIINPSGEIVNPIYRKIHIFDCPLVGLCESNSTGKLLYGFFRFI